MVDNKFKVYIGIALILGVGIGFLISNTQTTQGKQKACYSQNEVLDMIDKCETDYVSGERLDLEKIDKKNVTTSLDIIKNTMVVTVKKNGKITNVCKKQ